MENNAFLSPNIGSARNQARKLIKNAGITDAPVSLQIVIDYLKDCRDLAVIRTDFGEKISGILVMIDGKPTIGFNSNEGWYRRRFAIGHEIGHLILGHTNDSANSQNNKECEANQFAAELLMPMAFIKKDFVVNKNLDSLSKKYEVSKEALCVRLKDCRLI